MYNITHIASEPITALRKFSRLLNDFIVYDRPRWILIVTLLPASLCLHSTCVLFRFDYVYVICTYFMCFVCVCEVYSVCKSCTLIHNHCADWKCSERAWPTKCTSYRIIKICIRLILFDALQIHHQNFELWLQMLFKGDAIFFMPIWIYLLSYW